MKVTMHMKVHMCTFMCVVILIVFITLVVGNAPSPYFLQPPASQKQQVSHVIHVGFKQVVHLNAINNKTLVLDSLYGMVPYLHLIDCNKKKDSLFDYWKLASLLSFWLLQVILLVYMWLLFL